MKFVKILNQYLFASVMAATLGWAGQANAQYKPTGEDGITASPRVRQQLNERAVATRPADSVSVAAVTLRTPELDGVTASAKVRQMPAERHAFIDGTPSIEAPSAGYRPTGSDGIAASPRLRQQLDERRALTFVPESPDLPRAFTKN